MAESQQEQPPFNAPLMGSLRASRDDNDTNASSETQVAPDEQTTLLRKLNDGHDIHQDTDALKDDDRTGLQLVAVELWILFKGSVPVILAYTLQNMLQTISVLIVGRLSPEALSVAAFCYMWAMATAWLIALGGTTAIDTIASASFTGSQNKHDLGIILQRALVVLTVLYIPVVVLWIFSSPIFLALGQEEYIARDGSKFLIALIPGGLGYIYFESLVFILVTFPV
jgi:MATE family multidrug resistance protein